MFFASFAYSNAAGDRHRCGRNFDKFQRAPKRHFYSAIFLRRSEHFVSPKREFFAVSPQSTHYKRALADGKRAARLQMRAYKRSLKGIVLAIVALVTSILILRASSRRWRRYREDENDDRLSEASEKAASVGWHDFAFMLVGIFLLKSGF